MLDSRLNVAPARSPISVAGSARSPASHTAGPRVYGRSPANRTPSSGPSAVPPSSLLSMPASANAAAFNTRGASNFGDSTAYAGPPAATQSRATHPEFHDATPASPTEDKAGGALGLRSTVYTAHAGEPGNPQRHKTYLIVANTADLTQADVDAPWFVSSPSNPDQQDARQTLGLRFPSDNTADPDVWGRLGSCTGLSGANVGSSSRTDAHIAVQLHGTTGSSGWRTLAQEGEGISDTQSHLDVFAPGGVDEFAITCMDLGDLQRIDLRQEGNGKDQNSSLWKLGHVAITTVKNETSAARSVKTQDNPNWIFVPCPGEEWIGRFPRGSRPNCLKIEGNYPRNPHHH